MKKIILFIVCFSIIFTEAYAMQSKLSDKEKSIVEISAFTSSGNQEQLAVSLNKVYRGEIIFNQMMR